MGVCACIWVYVPVYRCMCLCMGVCACIWVYVPVYGCMCLCMGVCAGIWVYVPVYGCMCLYMGVCACIWVYVPVYGCVCRSHWPRSLRRRSAAARLLRLWVPIPPGAWMFVCCECCVLSGRGLCDGLITRPEESYRPWCIVVCDQETSRKRGG
jgi:hypothetical protein